MPPLTPRPGTDGNLSCGYWSSAADEDSAATILFVDDSAFHAAGHRYDLAGDMA
jgi:hypothetical protein